MVDLKVPGLLRKPFETQNVSCLWTDYMEGPDTLWDGFLLEFPGDLQIQDDNLRLCGYRFFTICSVSSENLRPNLRSWCSHRPGPLLAGRQRTRGTCRKTQVSGDLPPASTDPTGWSRPRRPSPSLSYRRSYLSMSSDLVRKTKETSKCDSRSEEESRTFFGSSLYSLFIPWNSFWINFYLVNLVS